MLKTSEDSTFISYNNIHCIKSLQNLKPKYQLVDKSVNTTINEAVENFSKNCIEMKDLPVENSQILDGFLISQGPSPKHSVTLNKSNVAKGFDASASRFLVWTMTKNADSGEDSNFYFEYSKAGNSTFQTSSVFEFIFSTTIIL